jgi:hypothetical protein
MKRKSEESMYVVIEPFVGVYKVCAEGSKEDTGDS